MNRRDANRWCALLLVPLSIFLSACDTGLQTMGTTEYGVRFRKIPLFLGGGIGGASSVVSPLETVVVMPWGEILRFDTSPQYLSWGKGMGEGGSSIHLVQNEDVHTRAKDGNEADLKIKARYRIKPNPETLVTLAQQVATTVDGVRELVVAAVQSDVRTHMNRLRTAEFRDDKKRNDTIDAALKTVQKRLGPLGIDVEAINLTEYRFVRVLGDDKEDTSYQDRLRDIQEKEQDIEGELSRVETVRARRKKELLEAQSAYNSRLSEAQGFKSQSIYQGDGYFAARANEAKAILAEGTAEIEGLRQQIAALSGKGGKAILRLEVAKQLARGNPKFVTMGDGGSKGGAGLEVSRTDMNQLIQQLGVVEGLVGAQQQIQTPPGRAAGPPPAQPRLEDIEGDNNGK